jgi:hypothetical protein
MPDETSDMSQTGKGKVKIAGHNLGLLRASLVIPESQANRKLTGVIRCVHLFIAWAGFLAQVK